MPSGSVANARRACRTLRPRLVIVMLGAIWLGAASVPTPGSAAVPSGEWVDAASGIFVAIGHPSGLEQVELVVLADGTPVLFAITLQGIHRYRADTGEWIASGRLQVTRFFGATATALDSDAVLIAGGRTDPSRGIGLRSSELYSVAADGSSRTGDMQFARTGHRATLLASGKVLVTGGTDENGDLVGPAEIYDPATRTWSPTGSLQRPRILHAAVRLPSGKVLVAGGHDGRAALASAELYDPLTGEWTTAADMDQPRSSSVGIALLDGHALLAGAGAQGLDSVLYDPATNTWAPPTIIARDASIPTAVVILRDGTPLLVSQLRVCSVTCQEGRSFLFDLDAEAWSPSGVHSRAGSAVVLPDGRVLKASGNGQTAAVELYRSDNSTPRLTASPALLDFGRTGLGVAVQDVVTIQNTGGATLRGRLTPLIDPTPVSIVGGSIGAGAPFTLEPGASATVGVRLVPDAFGSFSGSVRFVSNGNVLLVPVLAGTGVLVSGRVSDGAGNGLRDVLVILDRVGANSAGASTDALGLGRYQFFVSPNGQYTIRPQSPAVFGGVQKFPFAPSVRSVVVGSEDVSGLDFIGAPADGIAAFVDGLYREVLGRGLDASGFPLWLSRLREQCDANQFRNTADGFFDSSEFRTLRPLTMPALVTALYRSLLAREPDPDGLTSWVAVFRQQRLALAASFAGSAEFQTRLPDRTNRQAVTALVTRLYTEILGHAPEPGGLAGWVDHVVATGDVQGLVTALLTSDEFEARALTSGDYVTILYRGVLGRDPGGADFAYWEGILRSSLRSVIQDHFISSPEFQRRVSEVCGS